MNERIGDEGFNLICSSRWDSSGERREFCKQSAGKIRSRENRAVEARKFVLRVRRWYWRGRLPASAQSDLLGVNLSADDCFVFNSFRKDLLDRCEQIRLLYNWKRSLSPQSLRK